MLMFKSTHEKEIESLKIQLKAKDELRCKYYKLKVKWNNLVERINEKGGESFLDGDSTQFSQDDIRRLLQLCHPDKHNSSTLSLDMTQKLNALKKRNN